MQPLSSAFLPSSLPSPLPPPVPINRPPVHALWHRAPDLCWGPQTTKPNQTKPNQPNTSRTSIQPFSRLARAPRAPYQPPSTRPTPRLCSGTTKLPTITLNSQQLCPPRVPTTCEREYFGSLSSNPLHVAFYAPHVPMCNTQPLPLLHSEYRVMRKSDKRYKLVQGRVIFPHID